MSAVGRESQILYLKLHETPYPHYGRKSLSNVRCQHSILRDSENYTEYEGGFSEKKLRKVKFVASCGNKTAPIW